MQKFVACLVCTLALMAVIIPITIAEDNQFSTANMTLNQTQDTTGNITLNETQNATEEIMPVVAQNTTQKSAENASKKTKVLRAGFEKTKPLNNLDVYGNNSTYSRPTSSAFNLSQRLGNVSKFTYNTDIYTPVYNVSQYSRTKPIYEVPGTLASRPVYSISGYPVAKASNSIP